MLKFTKKIMLGLAILGGLFGYKYIDNIQQNKILNNLIELEETRISVLNTTDWTTEGGELIFENVDDYAEYTRIINEMESIGNSLSKKNLEKFYIN